MKTILVKQDSPFMKEVSYEPHASIGWNILCILSLEYKVVLEGYDFEGNYDAVLQRGPLDVELPDAPAIGMPDDEKSYDISTLIKYDGIICYDKNMASTCEVVSVPCVVAHPVPIDVYKKIYNPQKNNTSLVTNSIFLNQQLNDIARIFHNLPIGLKTYYYVPNADLLKNRCEVLKLLDIELFEAVTFEKYFNIIASSFGSFNARTHPLGVNKAATYAAFAKKIGVGVPETFQELLYPSLTSYDWRYLREQIVKLIDDKSYYNDCAEFAYEKVHSLDMEKFKEPLLEFMAGIIE